MKKIVILFFMFFTLSYVAFGKHYCASVYKKMCFFPPIDTIRQYLMILNIDNLVDKPVDSVISNLPQNFVSREFTHAIKIAHRVKYHVLSLVYEYRNGDRVEIFVKKYRYMNPVDPNKIWDLNKYKKETTYVIQITGKSGFDRWAKGS